MGYQTSLSSSGPGVTPRRLTPPRAAPIGTTSQSLNEPPDNKFGQFRVDAADAANVIKIGASAPGYVMERPIAAVDTLTGGAAKGLIEQAGDTIRGIPILGDVLSGVAQAAGNTYEGANRVTRAPVNAGMANALRATAGMNPNDKVDGLTAWLSGAGGVMGDLTVAQLREIAARRGFSEKDIGDIASGRRGIFDYADKAVSDNALVDVAGSLALDPTNYLTLGVAGAALGGAAKVGRLIPGAARIAELSGIGKLAAGAHAINDAVGVSRVTVRGTAAGMAALRAGDVTGVTLPTLSRHLAMMFRGSSDFLTGYRKVAYATTAGQIAAQTVGDLGVLDNTPLGHLYEPLYKAAKAMGENKPLSEGGMFNLWAAINFPIRGDLSDAWADTKKYGLGVGVGRATARVRFPGKTALFRQVTDVERRIIEGLAPGKSESAGRSYLIERLGGEKNFVDLVHNFTRAFYAERELPKMNAWTEALNSTAEFSTSAAFITRMMDKGSVRALENGTISGRDVMEFIKDAHTGARSFETNPETGMKQPKAGAVDQAWDPEVFLDRWIGWSSHMRNLHALAGSFNQAYGVVVGIADGALPKEWLAVAEATLKSMKRADGTIAKKDMDSFLDSFPALTVDANDPSNFFARLRHPDSGEVHADAAVQRIKALAKEAQPLREYMYDVKQWEARAETVRKKRGSVLDENGNIAPHRAPDIGDAAVLTMTQQGSVRRHMGIADSITDIQQKRSDTVVRQREDIIAPGMEEMGFTVTSATQGVMSIGGQHRTAVAVHIPSGKGPAEVELAAAIVAEQTKSPYAIALISGADALNAHGLTRNADHVRFDMGSMGKDEADAVLEAISKDFDGSFEFNDTAGVAHILVRDGQEQAIQLLQREIERIVPERAKMSAAPAWVKVIANDTRGAVRSGRTVKSDGTASAILRDHALDIRTVNRKSAFRTALDERSRVAGDGGRPGFVGGEQRPGYDGVGGDGQPRGLTDDIRAADTTGTQGQVLWLAEKDDALSALTPKLGDDLRGLPDEEWAKVAPMEAELRRFDPQYRLKLAPGVRSTVEGLANDKPGRNAPTYYFGQGDALKDVLATSRATSDLMYHTVWKPGADFFHALFGRVYTKRLAEDAKQMLYGDILRKTANLSDDERPRIKDIDSFLQTLDAVAQASKLGKAQLFARGDLLPPDTIAEIATGQYTGRFIGLPRTADVQAKLGRLPVFAGFKPAALEALGGAHNMHKLLDRTGSRFYRDLKERTRGKGQLGALIRDTYSSTRVATATPRNYIKTFYHLFRFTLDPRWHVLNRMEADVLGHAKYGVSRFNGAKSPEAIDNAVRLHGGSMVGGESDLLRDALASGVLDARHLEGYIGRAFKKGRVNSTKEVIRTMAQEDPSIVQALQKFGGTTDEWVTGLENMMYEFDNKGVADTIENAAKQILDQKQLEELSPLLVRLYERNNQVFRDAVQTFHGNTNRGNLERIMNSYFLFWPISYQIKATKWLFDVMTKQTVGRQTNFLGVWTLDRMYQKHVERLANDEGYQRMFTDNPALWQFAAMLLPVTPFDMGISLSRFTRYSLAAGGFIKDKDFSEDPFDSALSLLKMGPLYSYELARKVYAQTKDKPDPLVVPVN